MRYAFKNHGEIVGYYELNPLPGANQIVVSNHSVIYPDRRGQGLGKKLAKEKIAQATILGFDYMLATVKANNKPQLKIMEENEWEYLDMFANRESGNTVFLYGKRLNDDEPKLGEHG